MPLLLLCDLPPSFPQQKPRLTLQVSGLSQPSCCILMWQDIICFQTCSRCMKGTSAAFDVAFVMHAGWEQYATEAG